MNFMEIAVKEAFCGIDNNEGGPFGAVIVKNGKVISAAHNEVIKNNDPTDHAEMVAIRKAAQVLKTFDLSDCEIYTTCEPCPMCLAAIYWAKIPTVYYGCNRYDAEKIGFNDAHIYKAIKGDLEKNTVKVKQIDREACLVPFEMWEKKDNKIIY
ncbi:MAG: nucleoside deaminase [Bacillota bacterium]|jgi:guanine deaminase